jgi:hypothetical protein
MDVLTGSHGKEEGSDKKLAQSFVKWREGSLME